MTFKRIFCAIDFSDGSEHVLRLAAMLASQHNCELIIFHSWYLPPSGLSLEYTFVPDVTRQILGDAQKRLDEAVEKTRKLGAKQVNAELANGTPWVEITHALEARGADLCIIGTHGRTGIKRVLLGSVAEKVVRHARCSVLVLPVEFEPTAFKNILVPTDFSASADYATTLATSLVSPQGTVHLLHCIDLPVTYGTPLALPLDYDKSVTDLLRGEVAKRQRQTTVKIEASHRIGSPGIETLKVIEQTPAIDVVVTGSHGHTGIKRALLGSVAEKIVRHAGRPVLVARRPDGPLR